MDWEKISSHEMSHLTNYTSTTLARCETFRMPVPGGTLYKEVAVSWSERLEHPARSVSVHMVFVPHTE